MIPPRLRKLPRLVAVDPRLEEVMPAVYRELMRSPWEVAPFGPGGGGHGPADDRPRVLVDAGDIAITVFVREFREARPTAPLFLVAQSGANVYRRLPLLARIGVDELYIAASVEEARLLQNLQRRAIVRAVLGLDQPPRVSDDLELDECGLVVRCLLGILQRDPCPPWSVGELYRRCGLKERTAERRIGPAAGVQLCKRVRCAVVERAQQLHAKGLTWSNVADLLGAPSVSALQMRIGRFVQRGL